MQKKKLLDLIFPICSSSALALVSIKLGANPLIASVVGLNVFGFALMLVIAVKSN